jgi:hypothetical protein
MSTSVPFPTLGPNGYILPSDADILAGVQADLNAAFGGNMNMALSTPQGQLASSIAAQISDCFAQFLTTVSQVDPLYAQGRMQDAIGYIWFLNRFPATPTQVTATANTTGGATIPAVPTVTAIDGAGNLYTCPGATISSGSQQLVWTAVAAGAIPYVEPLKIYSAIPGWSSISGAVQTILGDNIENQQQFEARRSASVGLNAKSALQNMRAAILASSPGLACACAENPSNSTEEIDGVSMPANSIFIAVSQVAGTIIESVGIAIATAIYNSKNPGIPYATSGTTYPVIDVDSGQTYYPQFVEATQVPLNITVTLVAATNPPANASVLIAQAITSAFDGSDGGIPVGYRIGGTVYASRFYSGILASMPGVATSNIQIGTSTPSATSQAFNLNQIPIVGAINVVQV